MLVALVGYAEASDRTGIKQCTLRQWAKRFAWHVAAAKPAPVTNGGIPPVTHVTRSPADSLSDILREDSDATRIALARAHRTAAEGAAKLSAARLLKRDTAQAVRLHGQGAGLVHAWREDNTQGAITLNVLNVNGDMNVARDHHTCEE